MSTLPSPDSHSGPASVQGSGSGGPSSDREYAAIVLAGGTGARMAGVDKAALDLEGRPLLAHVLDAVSDAAEVVVVGDEVPTARSVTFVREQPAYGGPAAGLLTGLATLDDSVALAAVLAVDMPRITPATVRRLLRAAAGQDGATLVDRSGRRQLAMALDVAAVRAAAPAQTAWSGLSLGALLDSLELVMVPAIGDEARDVDTWADLRGLQG